MEHFWEELCEMFGSPFPAEAVEVCFFCRPVHVDKARCTTREARLFLRRHHEGKHDDSRVLFGCWSAVKGRDQRFSFLLKQGLTLSNAEFGLTQPPPFGSPFGFFEVLFWFSELLRFLFCRPPAVADPRVNSASSSSVPRGCG